MSRTQIDPSLVPSSQNATNILINGGMEFWQRGTSFSSPGDGIYTADRWQTSKNSTPTFTLSQETSIIDPPGTRSMKIDITNAGASTSLYFRQQIERYQDLRGKTLTLSARVRSNSNKFRIEAFDGTTDNFSTPHSGSGLFETLTLTFTVSASPTAVQVGLGFMGGNSPVVSTSYVDSVMLVVGSVASPFNPTNYATELVQCQRYYEKSYPLDTAPGTTGGSGWSTPCVQSLSSNYNGTIVWRTTKRTSPTVTLYNTNTGSAGSWRAISTAGVDGNISPTAIFATVCQVIVQNPTNSSPLAYGEWTADAELP